MEACERAKHRRQMEEEYFDEQEAQREAEELESEPAREEI